MTTLPGTPLSALQDATGKPTPDDRILAYVGGKMVWLTIQLAQTGSVPLSGVSTIDGQLALTKAPTDDEHVIRKVDLAGALADSNLAIYADQAATGAKQSQASAAASGVNSGKAAQSASDAATILEGTQQAQSQIEAMSTAAQNALSGVTADANAAKVLITAALDGTAPLTNRGYWNAATNSPALTSGVGTEGDLYIVSDAGTTALDGNASWSFGDAAWFTQGKWQYFARAGWAAVAQSLYALGTLTVAGVTTGAAGSDTWLTAWLNSYAEVLAGIEADGSPVFPGQSARVGQNLLQSSALSGSGVLIVDEYGSVIANNSTASFAAAAESSAPVAPASRGVLSRGPGANDDLARGFPASALWLYNRALYQNLFDTNGAACWDVLTASKADPIADGFGTALAAAYGLDAALSGYTGPVVDVSVTVSGAAVVTTVAILPSGQLDRDALAAALSRADAGTVGTVTRWYDQSGNGHHLTTVSGAGAPRIGQAQVGGRPCISFDTTGAAAALRLANADLSFASGTFSVLAVGRAAGTNCSGDDRISAVSVGTYPTRVATVSGINEDGRLGIWDSVALQPGKLLQSSNPGVFGISATGGTTVTVWHGETSDPVTVSAAALNGTMAGLSIGSGDALSNACNFNFTGLVVLNTAATAAQVQRVHRSAALRYGFPPQAAWRVLCLGDSRTAGYLNSDGANWPAFLPDSLAEQVEIFNLAVSGSTSRDTLQYTLASAEAALSEVGSPPTIVTIWLGVNDFSRIGGSDYSVLERIQSLISGVLAAGARHVFLITEAPAVNQLTWQGATASGYFGDQVTLINPFQSGFPFADHSDLTLWHPDGIHPTRAGDRFLSSFVAAAINRYFEQENAA